MEDRKYEGVGCEMKRRAGFEDAAADRVKCKSRTRSQIVESDVGKGKETEFTVGGSCNAIGRELKG